MKMNTAAKPFAAKIPSPIFSELTRKSPFPSSSTTSIVPAAAEGARFRLFSLDVRGTQRRVRSVRTSVSRDARQEHHNLETVEVNIEKVIYGCRFFAILAVWGSLVGSFLCFFKGCTYVFSSYKYYLFDRSKVIASLVEATDVYLLGTVMLVFGMGLYELFISNLDKAKSMSEGRSNLFGLFTLKERPKWLEITSVNELKTKLGHVIVMLLLIGFFDKSKRAVIQTPLDLLCFSASVLLSSSCLFLLSKLNE